MNKKTSEPALGLALLRKDLRVNLEVDLWLNPQEVEKQRYEETDQILVQSSRKSLI